jgi:hypothetical protein
MSKKRVITIERRIIKKEETIKYIGYHIEESNIYILPTKFIIKIGLDPTQYLDNLEYKDSTNLKDVPVEDISPEVIETKDLLLICFTE